MKLYSLNYELHYEGANTARLFYKELTEMPEDAIPQGQDIIITNVTEEDDKTVATCEVITEKRYFKHKSVPKDKCKDKIAKEILLAGVMYDLLCEITGKRPPWGILTGIRPVKLIRDLRREYGENLHSFLKDDCRISEEKINLAYKTEKIEDNLFSRCNDKSISIYISIPFCPSRCNYCSFVSRTIEKAGRLIDDYVGLLCEEIKLTAKYVNDLCLNVESIYFGGGTPTSLTADQLEKLLLTVNRNFDLSKLYEYTVEGGRPDTITKEKLEVIKKYGVNRLSINPQTMNDYILEVIGRRHTAEDIINAYNLAKSVDNFVINMDIIAGLPEDNLESFKNTVDTVIDLAPQNITVHTLSVKRSSFINEKKITLPDDYEVAKMVEYATGRLSGEGYLPYYMYRQRNTLANAENIGWAKAGTESYYNACIMDEMHSIFACGAGAVTKLKRFGKKDLERICNFKYPYEYINRFDEIAERKKYINEFYKK